MSTFKEVLKYNYKLRDGYEIVSLLDNGRKALLSSRITNELIEEDNAPSYVSSVFNPSLNELAIDNLRSYLQTIKHTITNIEWIDGNKAKVTVETKLKRPKRDGNIITIYTDIDGVSKKLSEYITGIGCYGDNTKHIASVLACIDRPIIMPWLDIKMVEPYLGRLCYLNEDINGCNNPSYWEERLKDGSVSLSTCGRIESNLRELIKDALTHEKFHILDFKDMVTAGREDTFILPLAFSPFYEKELLSGKNTGFRFTRKGNAAIAIWEDSKGTLEQFARKNEGGVRNLNSWMYHSNLISKEIF